MNKAGCRLLISLLFFFSAVNVFSIEYYGYVTDHAGIFSARDEVTLTKALETLKAKNGTEFAVLTVPALNGEDIDTYKVRVFNEWGIGDKQKDNGLLLVIAVEDRKYGLEVGYGLEGIITDGYSGRTLRNILPQYFKEGNYYEGVYAFVNTIYKKLTDETYDSEYTNVPVNTSPPMKFSVFSIFILLFGLTIVNAFLRKLNPGLRFVFNFIIVFIFTVFIVNGWLLRLIISFMIAISAMADGRSSASRRGYFYTSHDSGFGGSSGGFGGFGGGSSGGGGASGSW